MRVGGAEADGTPGTEDGRGASYVSGAHSGAETGGAGGEGTAARMSPESLEADSRLRVTPPTHPPPSVSGSLSPAKQVFSLVAFQLSAPFI